MFSSKAISPLAVLFLICTGFDAVSACEGADTLRGRGLDVPTNIEIVSKQDAVATVGAYDIHKSISEAYSAPKNLINGLEEEDRHADGHEYPATRRQLLQELPEIPSAEITNVNTPQQLVAAIGRGDRDIVITDHLDLTTVPLMRTGICLVGCMSPLGVLKGQTRSIRGNCTGQPDEANFPNLTGEQPLLEVPEGRCFLLTFDDLLAVTREQFWADNLYLRAALPEGNLREFHFPALISVAASSSRRRPRLFFTNMTLQGDGEGSTVGIGVDSRVFLQDVLFSSLGGLRGEDVACDVCSSAVEAREPITLDRCKFENPFIGFGSRYLRVYQGGAVMISRSSYDLGLTAPFEMNTTNGLGFWSDDETGIGNVRLPFPSTRTVPTQDVPATPVPDPNDPDSPLFLTEFDPWFVALRQELLGIEITIPPTPQVVPPPEDPPPTDPQGENQTPMTPVVDRGDGQETPSANVEIMKGDDGEISLSAGAIGGIAVASLFGLMLLIALGGIFFIYMRVNKEDIRREKTFGKPEVVWSDIGTILSGLKTSSDGSMVTFKNETDMDVHIYLTFRDNHVKTISPNFSADFEGGAVSVSGGLKVELEQDDEEEYASFTVPKHGKVPATENVGRFTTGRMTAVTHGVDPPGRFFVNRKYRAGHTYIFHKGYEPTPIGEEAIKVPKFEKDTKMMDKLVKDNKMVLQLAKTFQPKTKPAEAKAAEGEEEQHPRGGMTSSAQQTWQHLYSLARRDR